MEIFRDGGALSSPSSHELSTFRDVLIHRKQYKKKTILSKAFFFARKLDFSETGTLKTYLTNSL